MRRFIALRIKSKHIRKKTLWILGNMKNVFWDLEVFFDNECWYVMMQMEKSIFMI